MQQVYVLSLIHPSIRSCTAENPKRRAPNDWERQNYPGYMVLWKNKNVLRFVFTAAAPLLNHVGFYSSYPLSDTRTTTMVVNVCNLISSILSDSDEEKHDPCGKHKEYAACWLNAPPVYTYKYSVIKRKAPCQVGNCPGLSYCNSSCSTNAFYNVLERLYKCQ